MSCPATNDLRPRRTFVVAYMNKLSVRCCLKRFTDLDNWQDLTLSRLTLLAPHGEALPATDIVSCWPAIVGGNALCKIP